MRTVASGGSQLGFGLAVKLHDDFTGSATKAAASMTALERTATKTAVGTTAAMANLTAGLALTGVGIGMMALPAMAAASVAGVETHMGALRSVGIENTEAMYEAAFEMQDKWAGVTASSFANAAYDVKSALSHLTDDAVAEFTKMAALTAKATKSTVEVMTELFAKGYGIYKEQFKDLTDMEFAQTFAGGLAYTVKAYRTTGDAMSAAMTNLGAAATVINVPLSEQLAIMGMLQTTMGGERAGVTYQQMINTLDRVGEKLKITNKIVDQTTGNYKPMADILDIIRQKTEGMGTAAASAMLREAVGSVRAAKGFELLIKKTDELRKGSKDLAVALTQGVSVAEEMAMMMNIGIGEQLKILGQRFLTFFQRIGRQVAPLYMPVIVVLGRLFETLGSLVKAFPAVTKAIIVFMIVGGALLTLTGLIVTGMALVQLATIHLGAAFVTTLIPKAIAIVTTLGSVLLPLMLLAGAAYLVYRAWKADFAGLQTTVMKFIRPVQTLWQFVSRALGAMSGGMATFRGKAADEMMALEAELKRIGIYNFARILIKWLYRAGLFFKGFASGMVEGALWIADYLKYPIKWIGWLTEKVAELAVWVVSLFGAPIKEHGGHVGKVASEYERWGVYIGRLMSWLVPLLGVLAAYKVAKMGINIVTTGWKILTYIPGMFTKIYRAVDITQLGMRVKMIDMINSVKSLGKTIGFYMQYAASSVADFGKSILLVGKKVAIWAATMSVNAYKAVVKWVASLLASTTATTANTISTSSATVATGTMAVSQTTATVTTWSLTGALSAAASAAWAFTAALLTNPITWIIVGIVALGVAIYMLVKHWDSVTAAFKTAWSWIVGVFAWVRDKVVAFVDYMPDWALTILAAIMPIVGLPLLIIKHWETVKRWFGVAWEWIAGGASKTWKGIKAGWDWLADVFRPVGTFLWNTLCLPFRAVYAVANWVWELIKAGWDWLVNGSVASGEKFKQILTMPFKLVPLLADLAWDLIKFGASKLLRSLGGIFGEVWGVLTQPFKDAYDYVADLFVRLAEFIGSIISSAMNGVKDLVMGPLTWIGDKLEWLWGKVSGAAKAVGGAVADASRSIMAVPSVQSAVPKAAKGAKIIETGMLVGHAGETIAPEGAQIPSDMLGLGEVFRDVIRGMGSLYTAISSLVVTTKTQNRLSYKLIDVSEVTSESLRKYYIPPKSMMPVPTAEGTQLAITEMKKSLIPLDFYVGKAPAWEGIISPDMEAKMAALKAEAYATFPSIPVYSNATGVQGAATEMSLWGAPSSSEATLRPSEYPSEVSVDTAAISQAIVDALVQQRVIQQQVVFGPQPAASVEAKPLTQAQAPIQINIVLDGKVVAKAVVDRLVNERVKAYGQR